MDDQLSVVTCALLAISGILFLLASHLLSNRGRQNKLRVPEDVAMAVRRLESPVTLSGGKIAKFTVVVAVSKKQGEAA